MPFIAIHCCSAELVRERCAIFATGALPLADRGWRWAAGDVWLTVGGGRWRTAADGGRWAARHGNWAGWGETATSQPRPRRVVNWGRDSPAPIPARCARLRRYRRTPRAVTASRTGRVTARDVSSPPRDGTVIVATGLSSRRAGSVPQRSRC